MKMMSYEGELRTLTILDNVKEDLPGIFNELPKEGKCFEFRTKENKVWNSSKVTDILCQEDGDITFIANNIVYQLIY